MKTWIRLGHDALCGGCGLALKKHAAAQALTLPGVTRPRLRCPLCADEPVPAHIPLSRDPKPSESFTLTPDHPTSVADLAQSFARDHKQKSAGE